MIARELVENFEDKEISQLVLEYYDFAGGISLGMQQCLDEVKQLKDRLNGRKFKKFVEIGRDEGGSLFLFSKLFLEPGAHIFTIDVRDVMPGRAVINRLAKDGFQVHPVNAFSYDVNLAGFECDLLHIDGDHSYESVKGDFYKYFPTLVPGGVCFMHDTLLWPGAIKFREELEQSKLYNMATFKGHLLVSGDFWVKPVNDEKQSTGITMVVKP